jgi:branched-chain amino acid transport system ATP-binding protein
MPESTEAVAEPGHTGPARGPLLDVVGISAWYGEARVLTDVSLEVAKGEVVTLVGRNGAGKTTLLRSVMGLHKHAQGMITFEGVDVTKRSPDARAKLGLGWVPDDRGIYATLSVEENLLLPPVVHDAAWPIERVYEHFPVLQERRDFTGTKLSGGEQQMLAVARALRMGARLLLLDEPSEGLAPVIVRRIGEIIREIKGQGVGVLLVEQNVKFASTVADRHYLLAQGRVVEHLDNEEFQARESELLRHLGL